MKNLSVHDLFAGKEKFSFLVGAGSSISPPSCLPTGKMMMETIIKYSCSEPEIDKILGLSNLRYEHLMDVFRRGIDSRLQILNYFSLCNKPNKTHKFLAEMIKRGHIVLTTNFDFLLEHALLQSGVDSSSIRPIIAKEDFLNTNPYHLFREGKFPIYKIHGSTKNMITDQSTTESLIATINAFGTGKEEDSIFQLEPYKKDIFDKARVRTIVVIGYSGSDDFDIMPTLRQLKNTNMIVWVEHMPEGTAPIIDFIEEMEVPPNDKIGTFLKATQKENLNLIYRVKMNTSEFVEVIHPVTSDENMGVIEENFNIDLMDYLETLNITPNIYVKWFFPLKIYRELSMMHDAKRCAEHALEIAERENNVFWKSKSLNELGIINFLMGNFDDSLENYEESLKFEEEKEDDRGKSSRFGNIAYLLHRKGEMNRALEYYTQAIEIAEKNGDKTSFASITNNLGLFYLDIHKIDNALEHFQRSLKIVSETGDIHLRSTLLGNIGAVYVRKRKWSKVLSFTNEALAINEQLGDLDGMAKNLTFIADVLEKRGKRTEALQHLHRALEIAQKNKNRAIIANVYYNIGLFWTPAKEMYFKDPKNPRDIVKARDYYERALEINEEIGIKRSQAEVTLRIAELDHEERIWENAASNYAKSLEMFTEVNAGQKMAYCNWKIGMMHYHKEDFASALDYYKKSRQIYLKIGESVKDIDVWMNKAESKL